MHHKSEFDKTFGAGSPKSKAKAVKMKCKMCLHIQSESSKCPNCGSAQVFPYKDPFK